MIATFVIITLASAALAIGVLLVMTGAVTFVSAGQVETGADRRHYQWVGAAMAASGLILFVAGTMLGVGSIA